MVNPFRLPLSGPVINSDISTLVGNVFGSVSEIHMLCKIDNVAGGLTATKTILCLVPAEGACCIELVPTGRGRCASSRDNSAEVLVSI